ncbi:MAG: rhomboid family intramembrane serine protease [Roseburia sp.]|nr:rhomboid family intramembrane serine protease [Roseburia sp.]
MDENAGNEKIPFITLIFVAANVIAFFYTEMNGSSLDANYMISAGAMYGPAFLDGHEYYRVFTHFFLHFGLEHLASNMVSLLVLGYALENRIGRGWYCFIYLFSGIFAGLVSVFYNLSAYQERVSCGASGAIYGLMGALFVVLIINRRNNLQKEAFRFLLYIVLILYSGMQDSGIDNTAHVGGFLGGFLVCVVMCIKKKMFTDGKEQGL